MVLIMFPSNPSYGDTSVFPKLFRFSRAWLTQEDFVKLVPIWWDQFQIRGEVGNGWRLKNQHIKRKMRGWSANLNGAIKRQKEEILQDLNALDIAQEGRELEEEEWAQWWLSKQQLDEIYRMEEIQACQRAQITWLKEGNSNTPFCHQSIREKRRRN
jgi:hypothetical protein